MSRRMVTVWALVSGAWLGVIACGSDSSGTAGGCTTDTQCKGDRLCVDGSCVSPDSLGKDAGPDHVDAGTVYSGGSGEGGSTGGSASNAGVGGRTVIDDPELEQACSRDCESRKAAQCAMDVGSLDQCYATCLVIDESTQGYCLDEMTDRYACSAAGGYTCVSGYPQPKATCIAEQTALSACNQLTPCRSYCDHLPQECAEAGADCMTSCMDKRADFQDALCDVYFTQLLSCWSRGVSCTDGRPEVGNCGSAVANVADCIARRNHECDGYCWAAEALGCAPEDCASSCRATADASSCGSYYRRLLDCSYRYGRELLLTCVDGVPTPDPVECASEIQQYDACMQPTP